MKIIETIATVGNKIAFGCRKNGPQILLVFGIGGVVTGTIMACCAAKKSDAIAEKHDKMMEPIRKDADIAKKAAAGEAVPEGTVIKSEQEIGREKAKVYVETGFEYAKAFAPAIIVEGLGIGCIIWGHKLQSDRIAGLGTALTASNAMLANYRANVVEKFGEEVDKEMLYGIKEKDVEVSTTDEEGNEIKVTEARTFMDLPQTSSQYVYFFDATSRYFEKDDPVANKLFLMNLERYMNEKLRNRARANGGRGFMFLNEVLIEIWPDGSRNEKKGQYLGWVYDEKHPVGDNYIDFGIFYNDEGSQAYLNNKRFEEGLEPVACLCFNCDGDVLSLM